MLQRSSPLPASAPDEVDYTARARALMPLAREAADEADRERRLPERVALAMARAGLYRVAAPAWVGGSEQTPMEQIRVIEAIATGDGSAGWNVMIGIETFSLLGLAFAKRAECFADPAVIACSATSHTGVAEIVDGGYRVCGRWPFVSGCHNSAFFAGLVAVHRNGAPAPERPPAWALVPRARFEILDTWDVAGMRGSGSHDVVLDGVFVPDEDLGEGAWSDATRGFDLPAVMRFPLGARLAYNKTGVGFGIARAAIDAFVDLAAGKTPFLSSTSLVQRPFAQRAVALAEARLRSARALVFELAESLWDSVAAGRRIEAKQRALFHIACADAARACAEAVDGVAEAAGTSANRRGSPLERHARDARVVRQHVTVAPHLIEDAGRVLLGLEPDSVMLKL